MPKKGFIPQKYKIWIDARNASKLSDKHILMARELGLNPKKLPQLANTEGAAWKEPLPDYLEILYQKRFKRKLPLQVCSLEELADREMARREARRAPKPSADAEQDAED